MQKLFAPSLIIHWRKNEIYIEIILYRLVVLSSDGVNFLPPPPSGYVWIVTTCRTYLVPAIYSPEILMNLALYYQV